MNYEIFGDFPVPRTPGKRGVSAENRRTFRAQLEAKHPGLASAVGCYVFAIRAGRGILPWYVGKTCKQGFVQECFEPHKLNHYNEVLYSKERGTPVLYLVARTTTSGRFSRSMPATEGKFLESMLIGMAVQRNKSLRNIVHTKFLQQLRVPGLVNPGKGPPRGPVADFKRMIGA